MRVTVMGAGGQGGFFASRLIQTGHNVSLIARGEHLKALQTKGLTVTSETFGDTHQQVIATDTPETIEPADLILFCVKTYDLPEASRQIKPLIHQGTMILPIQNGVEAPYQIGETVGMKHVLGGVSMISAFITAPGVIAHHVHTGIMFGELGGGISPRVRHLDSVFKEAGLESVPTEKIRDVMWRKFVWQTGLSGVLCLTRLPFEVVCKDEVSWGFMRDVMLETRKVAVAEGFDISEEFVDTMLDRFYNNWKPGTLPSMVGDLLAGRRMELEAYNGAVVRLGKKLGVETPLNYAIYASLRPNMNGNPTENITNP